MSKQNPSFLDVEDEDQRQKRIGSLLEKLNVTQTASATNPLLSLTDDKLGPITPPNELLARVQAFLPAIEASNEALTRSNPEDIDIENVAEHEGHYIEMNLGLGVFESKRPRTGSGSEDASSSEESESDSNSDFDSESSSGSESGDDDNSDSPSGSLVHTKAVFSRPIKPLPRRVSQRAKIQMLSSLPAPDSDTDVT
ncbi:hypothetical protein PAXRUDRAFT_134694 [Paxillus rubicundulus Ve08.2h10]|uniref:Unplaced genomic scaffold scaffold_80, whole genome shotgun sequence n=1 Tax=Paxillus rubicundulus Ve08.2h10 TaxID=930991 RepID=A0A0D0EBU2_9AGAM|nr:hypothetical protein PAXRUDRAFT_134694 [Paxillus rubicundulus Ve08.2h10]